MRTLALAPIVCALIAVAAPAAAQEPDSVPRDSGRVDTAMIHGSGTLEPAAPQPAPVPTPEQQRYLDGLRRVGRGISQLKTAVDQAARARAGTDSGALRRATRRLGGYCGSARSFMTGGRGQMQPTAYEDTTRLKARRLSQRVDEIISYTKTCETEALDATAAVMAEIVKRLQAYDSALAEFRGSIALPSALEARP